jgi:cytochrome c oxidase subunit 2
VIHSFFVPAFRVKRDVLPDRFTELWFRPTVAGRFHLFCAEFCGTDHSRMHGVVYAMKPEDYARWLQSGAQQPSLASVGATKFGEFGCRGCHDEKSSVRAPDLAGLFGRSIPLADGRWVTVDEGYLRSSMLQPNADIAAGYAAIMPSYAGRLSEQDILELVAYLKSLGTASAQGVGS